MVITSEMRNKRIIYSTVKGDNKTQKDRDLGLGNSPFCCVCVLHKTKDSCLVETRCLPFRHSKWSTNVYKSSRSKETGLWVIELPTYDDGLCGKIIMSKTFLFRWWQINFVNMNIERMLVSYHSYLIYLQNKMVRWNSKLKASGNLGNRLE